MKRKNSDMKVTIILLLTVFFVSMFIVIQPFNQEALTNTTMQNATALRLNGQNHSTETIDKDIPVDTELSLDAENGAGMITADTEQNNYEPINTYPSKIGTVLIISGNTIAVGSIGK